MRKPIRVYYRPGDKVWVESRKYVRGRKRSCIVRGKVMRVYVEVGKSLWRDIIWYIVRIGCSGQEIASRYGAGLFDTKEEGEKMCSPEPPIRTATLQQKGRKRDG